MNIETLKLFCRQDRIGFEQPFNQDSYTFATNGVILLRIKSQMELPGLKGRSAPNVARLGFSWSPPHNIAIPMPDVGPQLLDVAGTLVRGLPVRVGANFFESYLLRWLTILPGLKLYPKKKDTGDPMYFTFDEGDGYIMPLKF